VAARRLQVRERARWEGLSTGFAFLREAPDGTIWLSDNQGLRRLTSRPGAPAASVPRGRPAKTPPFEDFTFAADGSLWAVTEKGIQRFNHPERWSSAVPRETARAKASRQTRNGSPSLAELGSNDQLPPK
jgi:hypothetical protein